MKTLKVFECFAGIGAQHRAMYNLFNNDELLNKNGINKEKYGYEIVGTSEWFIDAIISYDLINHDNYKNVSYYEYLTKNYILKEINTFSLSNNSKTIANKSYIESLNLEKLKQLYIALNRNKNYGSILDINPYTLPEIDLLTYSFPCQNISQAGLQQGLEEGSNTSSSLLWEIKRILNGLKDINNLPPFLLMENVKNLLADKHYKGWKVFEDFLTSLGYKNTLIELNSLEVGIPQSRDRVFCISELNGKTNFTIKNYNFDYKDIKSFLNVNNDLYIDEYKKNIPLNSKYRIRTLKNSTHLNNHSYAKTITTRQDRLPNSGIFICDENGFLSDNILDLKDKASFRFITPREALLLMGFTNEDYKKMTENDISDSIIYMCAGNSIVVNKLEVIFIEIIKRFCRIN